jgi:long-chain acyl-CoA synthetase
MRALGEFLKGGPEMLLDNLEAIASRAPVTSGLRLGDAFVSYGDLVERASRLASGLAEFGIGSGAVVALVLPNGPDLFAISYGLFALGAVAMPLNISAPAHELAAYLKRGAADAVVGRSTDKTRLLEAIAIAFPEGKIPLLLSGEAGPNGLDSMAASPVKRFDPVPGSSVAIYLFSSGSTGLPKVVPHTHAEMIANGRATAIDFSLQPNDIVFNNLPGNHAMGYLNSVFEVPEAGASTLYFSDPNSALLGRRKVLDTIVAQRVSILPGIPFFFDALAGEQSPIDLSAVRLVYSAGVPLRRAIFEGFRERFGFQIRQAYGCTEAGHVAFNRTRDVSETWDSVGKPVGDTRVELRSIDPATGLGELVIHSSSLTKGYQGRGDVNAIAFPDGWFASGDLGRIDLEGNVFIKGRARLVIEVAGHKVDPLEVEDVLIQHPAIAEAVVVGVDGGRSEQRVKAVIVLSDPLTPDGVISFARSRLAAQKVPTIVEFVDAIPKSASGKVLRGKLMGN